MRLTKIFSLPHSKNLFMARFKTLLFVFLATFFFVTMHSQNLYNSISYTTFVGEDDSFISLGKNAFNQFKKEVESQEFILVFNDSVAHFTTVDKMDNIMPFIEIYSFTNAQTALKIKNQDKIILKLDRNQQWVLTTETKLIKQFTCYKAIASYTIKRRDKTIQFPIIAWFCPELPYRFGPMGYGKLPGLILELQERNIIYGIKKIKLEPNLKKINLPSFNEYQEMTESEWEAIILKKMMDEN